MTGGRREDQTVEGGMSDNCDCPGCEASLALDLRNFWMLFRIVKMNKGVDGKHCGQSGQQNRHRAECVSQNAFGMAQIIRCGSQYEHSIQNVGDCSRQSNRVYLAVQWDGIGYDMDNQSNHSDLRSGREEA
jgi:hypothetical protein